MRSFILEALNWRVPVRWYLLALALPVAYFTVPIGISYVTVGAEFDPKVLPMRLAAFFVGSLVVMAIGGGQEELGWRGFALPQLQSAYGPVAASVGIGVLWAAWHLPLFLTSWRSSNLPFLAYLVMIVGMSFFFTGLYNVSGSVLVVMLLHGAQNAAAVLNPVPNTATLSTPYPTTFIIAQVASVWICVGMLLWIVGPSLGHDGTDTGNTDVPRPEANRG